VIWRWLSTRSREVGLTAALLFLAAPGAHFLSLPYTEALFCLLIASALWAIEREQLAWAALLGALASGSRPTGVVIALVLGVEGIRHRKLIRFGLASLFATSGLIAYVVFCARHFRDALYFSHVQKYWGREMSLLGPFKALFSFGFDPDYYLVTIVAIGVAIWLVRRERLSVSLSAWVLLLLPLMTGSLKSMIRFQSANVPLFTATPLAGRGRRRWIFLTISLVLMLYEAGRYAAGYANN
jgi:Gpi18-like mannosyltransferase